MSDADPRYAAFLERLRAYERFETVPKSRGPEKLDGVRRLAAELGHPEEACRVVHVAGTNGKGTTSAMIAALLLAAGRRTGLYTSPHVMDVRERIALDGAPIPEPLFAEAGHAVLDIADRHRSSIHFSYFDLLTLIARVAFRSAGLEWAVLEVGLGGLSDATNVGPKALCVITRIGLDHLHILGDTLEAIAAQKLGIVPPAVPAVLAPQAPALEAWIRERLADQDSPVYSAGDLNLAVTSHQPPRVESSWPDGERLAFTWQADDRPLTRVSLSCAATAIVAAERLMGSAFLPRAELLRVALNTHLPGRLERRHDQRVRGETGAPLKCVVLDGGHNADAMAELVAQLKAWRVRDYTLILALQRDKLVDPLRTPMAVLLAGAKRILILAPKTLRAPTSEELRDWLLPLLPDGEPGPLKGVEDAEAALRLAAQTPNRPVVLTGSFWMLGDAMRLLADADP